jgi:hypothetical protein
MKLAYYGGNGIESCPKEGEFEVKANDEVKHFWFLDDAVEYYNSLNCTKALWDITTIPELIECHVLKPNTRR